MSQIASLKLKIVETGNNIQSNMLNDCGQKIKVGTPTYREILFVSRRHFDADDMMKTTNTYIKAQKTNWIGNIVRIDKERIEQKITECRSRAVRKTNRQR